MANMENIFDSLFTIMDMFGKGANEVNPKYSPQISILAESLEAMGIEFANNFIWDGYQIVCGDWDVVCHSGSYGHEEGLLEAAGSIVEDTEDTVEGWLTAAEVIRRVKSRL